MGRRGTGNFSMDYPVRKRTRLKAYDYSQNGGYFVTICTKHRAPLFWNASGELSHIGQIALRCMEEIPAHISGVFLDAHCILPDHVHLILFLEHVGPPYMAADRSKQTLSRTVQQFKGAVTRQSGQRAIWQSGYYDHIIRGETDLSEIRRYIQENPLKWGVQ